MASVIPESKALSEVSLDDLRLIFNKNPKDNPYTEPEIEATIAYYEKLRVELASSATVRQTRVKKEDAFQQSLAANSDKLDLGNDL